MENLLNNSRLKSLTEKEHRIISGGEDQPNEDTGFWYDVFYVLTVTGVLKPTPTPHSTMVWMNMM